MTPPAPTPPAYPVEVEVEVVVVAAVVAAAVEILVPPGISPEGSRRWERATLVARSDREAKPDSRAKWYFEE
jgi:hypothetical protein